MSLKLCYTCIKEAIKHIYAIKRLWSHGSQTLSSPEMGRLCINTAVISTWLNMKLIKIPFNKSACYRMLIVIPNQKLWQIKT